VTRTDGYGDYPDLNGVNRVLVVKLRQHGDVLLTSPLFGVLRRALPSARIDAYVYRDTAPMLEGHPDVHAVHTYDRSGPTGLGRLTQELALIRILRAQAYDVIFNLTDGDRGALTAWIAGARVRVGLDPLGQGMAFKRRLYTHVVKRARTPRHMVEQNFDALRRIGIFPSQEERDLALTIPPAAEAAVDAHLRAAALQRNGFVLIHPTSRWLFKSWPTERQAALVRTLDGLGWRVVLSAAPDPREMAVVEDIVKLAADVNVVNLAGRLTLKELAALIAASRCLVCMDSVPMHMASALKHPVVALFGPSADQVWGPWRNPFGRVVSLDYSCRPCNLDGCGGSKVSDCLHSLPVETVVQAVRDLARPSV
jgi:heptosyltransferase-3